MGALSSHLRVGLCRVNRERAPVRVLEIGVQNGGSLQIWSKYFPVESAVVGIDVDPACASFAVEPNISIRIGDASNPMALDRMLGEALFDAIIDDGSHRSSDVVSTFQACFERLNPGGFYIVEDLHCSYWKSHGGGFRLADAAIEQFKNLIDALNADHFESIEISKLDSLELERLRRLGKELAQISFFNSLVVVEKLKSERQERYRRVLSGREAHVVDVVSAIASDPYAIRNLLLTHEAANSFTPALLDKLASAREEVGQSGPNWRSGAPTCGALEEAIAQKDASARALEEAIAQKAAAPAPSKRPSRKRMPAPRALEEAMAQKDARAARPRRGHRAKGCQRAHSRRGHCAKGCQRAHSRRGHRAKGCQRAHSRRGHCAKGCQRAHSRRGHRSKRRPRQRPRRGHRAKRCGGACVQGGDLTTKY